MENKKLLKNKIVDTLPVLYLETVILMVLGQFLGNFVLGIPVGIAYARNPEILNSAFLNTTLMYVIFWGIWAVALFWIGIRKRNRPILQAVGTKPQGNNWKYLLFGLAIFMVVMSIATAYVVPSSAVATDAVLEQAQKEQQTNPYNLPAGTAAPQTEAPAADAPATETPAPATETPAPAAE